eukprot:gene3484-6133_t
MSRALRPSGTSWDIPKSIFKYSLWTWFLYRVGESLLYYLLDKFKIPHTPKWKYDHTIKFGDNLALRDEWKKKKLFESGIPQIKFKK